VVGLDMGAKVAERARVERHQLVLGILVERRGELARLEHAQLRCGPRAVRGEAVPQAERDRPVARAPVALAQRREPARPEVDRVERQVEGGAQLRRPVHQAVLGGR
jgi:hypothetical protein